MSLEMMGYIGFFVMLALLAIGTPIGFALGLVGFVGTGFSDYLGSSCYQGWSHWF